MNRGIKSLGVVRWIVLSYLFISARVDGQQRQATATYRLQAISPARTVILVHATVPSDGAVLTMADSRPGDVPEVADAGWPALVKHLIVTDAQGHSVPAANTGPKGWSLAHPVRGLLTLDYQVDYAPIAAREWPAPRETAFADADHFVVIGRSLFITTPAQRASTVRVALPRGWQAVMPWPSVGGAANTGHVAVPEDLSENLVAFMRGAPDVVTAGGFNLKVVPLGHWQPARNEIRRALGAELQQLVALIGFKGRADYLVVLLPQLDHGGESFRESFALTLDADPSRANLGDWGSTIAHEVFHYWNGWRLKGADYASTQWFQEGFTEYAANLSLVSSGLISPEEFYAKLASHVTKYRKLTTPLDAPGTHKGPPLYSGGALVAFTWDTMIRNTTNGQRGIGDVLRALLRNTRGGARPYAWPDIQAALESVAPEDWAQFQRRYIHGTDPLPTDDALSRVGLRMSQGTADVLIIEPDPAALPAALKARRGLMRGTR